MGIRTVLVYGGLGVELLPHYLGEKRRDFAPKTIWKYRYVKSNSNQWFIEESSERERERGGVKHNYVHATRHTCSKDQQTNGFPLTGAVGTSTDGKDNANVGQAYQLNTSKGSGI